MVRRRADSPELWQAGEDFLASLLDADGSVIEGRWVASCVKNCLLLRFSDVPEEIESGEESLLEVSEDRREEIERGATPTLAEVENWRSRWVERRLGFPDDGVVDAIYLHRFCTHDGGEHIMMLREKGAGTAEQCDFAVIGIAQDLNGAVAALSEIGHLRF